MIKCKCIISSIDIGPDTEKIVSYTEYFASKTHATVRLLYVIDYMLTPPSYLTAYIEEEKKREESEMARWKTLLTDRGVKAEYGIVLGRLHESFVKVINETSPDLLVIGYKSHIIRPSSSERLIRSLNIPMLVVRGESAGNASIGSVNIKNILCPVDFSDSSKKAISYAKECASLFSSDLHLIHVIPSHIIKEKWFIWQKLEEKDREKFDETMLSEAKTNLSSLRSEYGIDREGGILQGNPSEMICSLAEGRKYDLIIMGARGLSYLQGIFIGSTTEAVLKSSPCPVLIVH